jgi:hypothetical protein
MNDMEFSRCAKKALSYASWGAICGGAGNSPPGRGRRCRPWHTAPPNNETVIPRALPMETVLGAGLTRRTIVSRFAGKAGGGLR